MDILVSANLIKNKLDKIQSLIPDGNIHSLDIPYSIKVLKFISRELFPYPLYMLSKRIFENDSVKILIDGRSITSSNKTIRTLYCDYTMRNSWLKNILKFLPNLHWVHTMSTGVDHLVCEELIDKNIVVTNLGSTHSSHVAEFALSLIFTLSKRLRSHILLQSKRRHKYLPSTDIRGKTVGIIGLGNIGRRLAHLALSIDVHVLAIRSDPTKGPDGFPVLPSNELDQLLNASDFVVLCVPLTEKTRDLIGERELRMMKKTAFLINIARGALIDEKALVRCLKEGVIAGAALDVTRAYKLPRFSPLYSAPNLILTPNVSFSGEAASDENFDVFLNNLIRFQKGDPLLNIIDLKKGY